MIELKKEFKKKGINYLQIVKTDNLFVYKLTLGNNAWFEVFKRIIAKSDIYHDDEYEKFPNDEAFGQWAWSCSNVECVRKVLEREFPMESSYEICDICQHVLS